MIYVWQLTQAPHTKHTCPFIKHVKKFHLFIHNNHIRPLMQVITETNNKINSNIVMTSWGSQFHFISNDMQNNILCNLFFKYTIYNLFKPK
jgi:hypothetical protein